MPRRWGKVLCLVVAMRRVAKAAPTGGGHFGSTFGSTSSVGRGFLCSLMQSQLAESIGWCWVVAGMGWHSHAGNRGSNPLGDATTRTGG